MATKKKAKSPVLERVEEELKASAEAGMIDDEEFDPELDTRSQNLMGGGNPFSRKSPAEIAVDRLLVGLKPGQGWYIKLSKETTPNDFQFKKRIDNFFNWTDAEYQINEIVRHETKAEYERTGRVLRWGSGRYQIVFWNDNGIRGEARAPHIIDVDAQEDTFMRFSENNQMNEGRATTDIIRAIHEATNPTNHSEQMATMLSKGMEIAMNKEAKQENSSNQMMVMFMQMMQNQQQQAAENNKFMMGLLVPLLQGISSNNRPQVPVQDPTNVLEKTIGMLSSMGILGNNQKQDSFLQNISTMQTLGLIKPSSTEDEMSTLNKIKTFMGFARDFAGAGPAERPGIMEKLVDAVGPKIGDIVGNITKVMSLQAEAKQQQITNGGGVLAFPGMPAPTPPRQQALPQPREYAEYEPPRQPEQYNMFPNIDDMAQPFAGMAAGIPQSRQQQDAARQFGDMRIDTGGGDFHSELMNFEPAFREPEIPKQPQPQPIAVPMQPQPQPTTIKGGPQVDMLQITKWTKELRTFVYKRDYSKFDYITQTIGAFFGGPEAVKQHAQDGTLSKQDVLKYILMFDKDSYSKPETMAALSDYVDKYVTSLLEKKEAIGICDTCKGEHVFDDEQHYKDEAGENDGKVICGIGGCQGNVTLRTLVNA